MLSYYKRNKERIKKYQQKWRKNNPEKRREQNKRYREKYPEKISVIHEKYRRKKGMKPRLNLSKTEKKERKTEQVRICVKKRRLKLRILIFQRDNFTCKICGRKAPEIELQIDHIYPKSKGGLNNIINYQTLCSDCNIGKSDSILQEFL